MVWPLRSGFGAIAALAAAGAAAPVSGALAAPADQVGTETQLCASCHGHHGLPSDHTVPIIWGQQAGYLRKQLTDYKDGDRDSQIMSSIAESLSTAQVAQVAAHFGAARWPAPLPAALPAAPAALAACRICHGPNLAGGLSPSGVAPRLAGQFSAYLIDTMNAYADGERANSEAMSSLMKSLSPDDRKTIADYLSALR